MDKDASVSERELRVLIKALTKSVEYIHKRHLVLTFIAGLLIGIGVAILVAHVTGMGKRLPDAEALLKKSDQALQELQQLRSSMNSLNAAKADGADIKAAVSDQEAAVTQGKVDSVQTMGDAAAPALAAKVHIHYARQKDKITADAFSDFLRKKGYASVDTERILHRWRDIRYFHDEDRQRALSLQKQFSEFAKDRSALKGINLKMKNLSKSYPRAQRGSIEIWVFF